jgi:hypothetical protein
MDATFDRTRYQPGVLEHPKMFRYGYSRHRERRSQLADVGWSSREPLEKRAPRAIRKGMKDLVEPIVVPPPRGLCSCRHLHLYGLYMKPVGVILQES